MQLGNFIDALSNLHYFSEMCQRSLNWWLSILWFPRQELLKGLVELQELQEFNFNGGMAGALTLNYLLDKGYVREGSIWNLVNAFKLVTALKY